MLPHREGEVLALRYGLFSGEPLSLADVAKVLKMSAEGVRKNELQAFRYLYYIYLCRVYVYFFRVWAKLSAMFAACAKA